MTTFIYEGSGLWPFLILTLGIGGFMTAIAGRGLASRWYPAKLLPLIVLLIAAFVRFLHFALYDGTLFSTYYFLADFIFCLFFAALSYFDRRAALMSGLYPWAFRRYGLLGWKEI